VVPRPRMLVERVQFALWEQSAVGRRMIAEAEPEQHNQEHPSLSDSYKYVSWRTLVGTAMFAIRQATRSAV